MEEKNENLKYWVWLSRIRGIGSVKKIRLIEKYDSPKKIWELSKEKLEKEEKFNAKIIDEILNEKYKKDLEKMMIKMQKEKIEIITIKDERYPKKLKQIYDKPVMLYAKGNTKLLNEFSLAVIGCRENSEYGKKVAIAVTKGIVKNNIITISGLARGIDSICHKETLNLKGKTIAVIGSSLDIIYPKENKDLFEEIIQNGGCIISEYPIGTKPEKMNFPARNRIISGISSGIVVIEAKKKSGTMTTVDFGLEQGKNIYAIPRKYY